MDPVKPQQTPEAKLHFLDYWRIIRLRKIIILAVFLLVVITTTAVTFVLPVSFSSTARLRVEKDTPDITPFGMAASSPVFDNYFLATEFEILKSHRILDQVIEQLDPALEDHEQQKAELTAQRDAFVLDDCRSRVERYPTDKAIRFELGVLYYNQGKLAEALPEFQQAENHPHKRLPAMLYSARCLAARNMNDMAARKLQTALKEKAGFDDERKELLYTLGCVLEKAGKRAEAITQFEQIYEVDMKFRDVAARVDDYHAGQG